MLNVVLIKVVAIEHKKHFLFIWHTLQLAAFQGTISEFLTKALAETCSALRFLQLFKCRFNGAYTYTLEYRMKGRSQSLFAEVWKTSETSSLCSSGHTVSLINIHHAQSTSNSSSPSLCCKCKATPSPPPPIHCHSYVYRQRLMGAEHCVTVLPCIEKTYSWKVQDKRCLPSDTLTTCHNDLLLFRSGSRELKLKCIAP